MASSRAFAASVLATLMTVVAACPLQAQDSPEAKAKMAMGAALRAAFPMPMTDMRTQQLTGRRLVLKKGRIVMSGDGSTKNVYENGKIRLADGSSGPAGHDTVFQPGAEFFVVGLWTNSQGVGLMLMTPDQKLRGDIQFPFPNGTIPPIAYVFGQISEVFGSDSAE